MATDKSDRDDFWDIDKLVPKKRGRLSPFASSSPARDVEIPAKAESPARDVEIPAKAESPTRDVEIPTDRSTEAGRAEDNTPRPESERRLGNTAQRTSSVEEFTYTPEGDGLIKSVTVRHFIDKYDFYDNFRKSALIYYDYRPTARAEFAQFYSYMPQYSQLNPGQKAYYFFWRAEMERGRFLKTDYSYVYLYVYEILNLPDKIPPEEGVMLLCRVWREYRRALPRLDLYFAIWVQDYCLVHRLKCPMKEIEDFIFDVISSSTFKEFYISDIGRFGGTGTSALLAYLSDYDWRRGKYAAGDPDADPEKRSKQATEYRIHMEGAMSLLFRDLWDDCIATAKGGKAQTVRRDAFPNALCTHTVKGKLEVEFYPIASATGLRTGVTAAVRYTENKIRALMGIRSRLAIKDLPNDYRRIIDYYFDAIERSEKKKREREAAPEYMRLYDAPTVGMSLSGADEIERASWDTTARLVVGMEGATDYDTARLVVGIEGTADYDTTRFAPENPADNAENSAPPDENAKVNAENSAKPNESANNNAPNGKNNDISADTAAGKSDTDTANTSPADAGIAETSTADGDTYGLSAEEIAYIAHLCLGKEYTPTAVPADTLVEKINEAFADGFGDVIIEPSEDGYAIIEDYREDITKWLYKITK